ncbi:cytochrome c551 [Salinibacillus xinjiangensis]|uniref:C-type cytochrome n=1 Tax=Salinibacillus xinjiangensis TaxID=1229268 RepID=A0A6G1X195_9BACI|nr:cytochrome c [Salinibacillus xinjiangensis]MRG84763.1 c-type cytochrome [Salinibacillus xinjiangensis]
MKKFLMSLLFVLALVLAACGGGDDNAGEGTDTGNNDAGTEEQADEGDGDAGDAEGGAGEDTGEEGDGAVDTAAAEEIFQNNCSMCHGADLTGGAGPDLTAVGSRYSKDEIVNIIQNGKGNMQAINISEEDANTVASWLATKK